MSRDKVNGIEKRHGDAFIDRVLIVDEPESAEHIKTLMEKQGYKTVVAKDGGQAHASFSLQKPDFVILELLLPGESGFEICERLKKLNKATPVMALTEIDLNSSRNLAARVGFDGYLTKPFDEETLVELIQDINNAVWERTHKTRLREVGSIRFTCHCGRRLAMLLKDRGKAMTCPDCNERIDVPEWAGSQRAKFFVPRGPDDESEPVRSAEPLKFVTIKCRHCGTFYRLLPEAMQDSRTCPKCHKQQQGPLSIVGAPLSRAALASSGRVLIIRSGKHRGKKLLLPDKLVVIGRSPTSHIRGTSPDISRRHCLLRTTPEGLMVRDLESKTGTFINGEAIEQETLMRPHDILQVGPMRLQLAGIDRVVESDLSRELSGENAAQKTGDFVRAKVQTEQFETTAQEAATVIGQHWEILRKRSQIRAQLDDSDIG